MVFFIIDVYRDYNCIFSIYRCMPYNSFTILYTYYCTKYYVVSWSLLEIEQSNSSMIHIDQLSKCSMKIFTTQCSLLLILVYILNVQSINSLCHLVCLELNTFNIGALSLYIWVGFKLIQLKYGYYSMGSTCTLSQSAYILSNQSLLSKNYYRRYLIYVRNF